MPLKTLRSLQSTNVISIQRETQHKHKGPTPPNLSKGAHLTRVKNFDEVNRIMRERGQILKWIGTTILIVGTGVNSIGLYPLGPMIMCVGGLIWMYVGILWRETSLIITNLTLSLVTLIGLGITLWN